VALKRYLVVSAIFLVFLAWCGVVVLAAALAKEYDAVGTMIPIFIALAVSVGVAIPASRRKSLRLSDYPRIEHLRIAGKYHGSCSQMGISPLRLRG
jgi:hypothetical protein